MALGYQCRTIFSMKRITMPKVKKKSAGVKGIGQQIYNNAASSFGNPSTGQLPNQQMLPQQLNVGPSVQSIQPRPMSSNLSINGSVNPNQQFQQQPLSGAQWLMGSQSQLGPRAQSQNPMQQAQMQQLLSPEEQQNEQMNFWKKLLPWNWGAAAQGVRKALGEKPPLFINAPRFTEGQYGLLGDIGSYGQQQFQPGNNPFDFGPIAQQARERFNEQTIPSLAERFAGLGALGSSGFNRQLAQAGRGFETDLSALQSKFALQRQPALNQLLGLGLTEPYLSNLTASNPGALPGMIKTLGQVGTAYATGLPLGG